MWKIGQVVKEEILDEQEKEYLRAVIKPFRQKVEYIAKMKLGTQEYIRIDLDVDTISLPTFEKGTMYKGMEVDREYTLEELVL